VPPLTLKPEHVVVIRRAMQGVSQEGTSTRIFAGAPYASGGKTGTAEKVQANGGYKKNARISSFFGSFPAHKPRYVLLADPDQTLLAPLLQHMLIRHTDGTDALWRSAGWEHRLLRDALPRSHGPCKDPVAQAGMVGIACGNSPAAMPAAGGKRAIFGTNPI
jgi:hypothetical protein